MDRQHFQAYMTDILQKALLKFSTKNKGYGQADDVWHNFRSSAKRVWGDSEWDTMFLTLMTYVDKHLVALCNGGIGENEYQERWDDIIVYACLAKAMRVERDFELMGVDK